MWGKVAGIAGKGVGFAGERLSKAVEAASYVGEVSFAGWYIVSWTRLFLVEHPLEGCRYPLPIQYFSSLAQAHIPRPMCFELLNRCTAL